MIRLAAVLLLSACTSAPAHIDFGEVRDQAGHVAFAAALARESLQFTDDYDGVRENVMSYARGREALQHDDVCGENCQRDLLWWSRGVDLAVEEAKRRRSK